MLKVRNKSFDCFPLGKLWQFFRKCKVYADALVTSSLEGFFMCLSVSLLVCTYKVISVVTGKLSGGNSLYKFYVSLSH